MKVGKFYGENMVRTGSPALLMADLKVFYDGDIEPELGEAYLLSDGGAIKIHKLETFHLSGDNNADFSVDVFIGNKLVHSWVRFEGSHHNVYDIIPPVQGAGQIVMKCVENVSGAGKGVYVLRIHYEVV